MLQGVLDSARSLTEARSGVITLLDDSGRIADFLSSGMTAEEAGIALGDARRDAAIRVPGQRPGTAAAPGPARPLRSLGLPEFRPPLAAGPVVPLWPRRSFTGATLPDTFMSRRRRGPGFRLPELYVA